MTVHPPDEHLAVAEVPHEVAEHLSACPRCRVQRRLLTAAPVQDGAQETTRAARDELAGALGAGQRVAEGDVIAGFTLLGWRAAAPGRLLYDARGPKGGAAVVEVFATPPPYDLRRRAALHHPGLPRVLAVDEEGAWLVREPVLGETLEEALAGASVGRWVALLAQCVGALAALHAAGLHHGHVGGRHARVGPGGRLQLLDGWGLGSADPETDWVATGRVFRELVPSEVLRRAPAALVELCASMSDPNPAVRPDAVEILSAVLAHHHPAEAHASRYSDEGTLGRGGMGVVHRVHDPLLRRHVALKALADGLDRPADAARFVAEAQVTAQLQHPGVVPVHEMSAMPDGTPYFTMKEVVGRTLADVLHGVHRVGDPEWTLPRLLEVFRRVCEAVAYAHARGVVHRDLKPGNVMIGDFGEVLVVDWGLAAVYADDVPEPVYADFVPRSGRALGTPGYMPAEQRAGGEAAPANDVYALGAMLWEILCGDPPDTGVAPFEPAELVSIARRALSTDPAARYPDALALAREVAAWQAGEVVPSHHYSAMERLGRTLRPYQTHLVVGSLGVLLLGALGTAASQLAESREENRRASAMVLAERAQNALLDGDSVRATAYAAASLVEDDQPGPRGIIAAVSRAWVPTLLAPPRALVQPCSHLAVLADGAAACASSAGLHVYAGDAKPWNPVSAPVAALAEGADGALGVASDEVRVFRDRAQVASWPVAASTLVAVDGAWAWAHEDRAYFAREGESPVSSPSLGESIRDMVVCGEELMLVGSSGLWHWLPGENALTKAFDAGAPGVVRCTARGRQLALASDDDILLWAVNPPVEKARIHEHEAPVTDLAWSGRGTLLASAAEDGTVRLWTPSRQDELARLPGDESGGVVAFSHDGESLVAATGGVLRRWDIRGSGPRHRIDTVVPVADVGWTSAGEVTTVDRNGVLRLFDPEHGHRTGRLRLAGQSIRAASGCLRTGALAVALCDGSLAVVEPGSLEMRWRVPAHESCASAVSWSPDARFVASGSEAGEVVLHATSGERLGALAVGEGPVHALQFTEDAEQVLAHTEDRVVLLATDGLTPVASIAERASSAALSPDGRLVAVGRVDGSVELLDAQGRLQRTMVGHTEPAGSARFSADGKLLATASRDRSVRLWEVATGREIARLLGHERGASSVSFREDDRVLASADSDGRVLLWDVDSARQPPAEVLARIEEAFGARRILGGVGFGP
ncbi:MAG: hypothetical protein EP330_15990 [Deltaproteobacteria bacterium]|nr:MAG: hypothetical protein EP330_15990 [Deltaproteobacteria bacterium]